jgi:hypothetical protein
MDYVAYADEELARDRVLRMNGCVGSPTEAWHPELPAMEGCLKYTDCPSSHPVVFFCTTSMFGPRRSERACDPGVHSPLQGDRRDAVTG